MSETDYNARLYEKMKAEQDKFHLPFCTCYDIIGMSTKRLERGDIFAERQQ